MQKLTWLPQLNTPLVTKTLDLHEYSQGPCCSTFFLISGCFHCVRGTLSSLWHHFSLCPHSSSSFHILALFVLFSSLHQIAGYPCLQLLFYSALEHTKNHLIITWILFIHNRKANHFLSVLSRICQINKSSFFVLLSGARIPSHISVPTLATCMHGTHGNRRAWRGGGKEKTFYYFSSLPLAFYCSSNTGPKAHPHKTQIIRHFHNLVQTDSIHLPFVICSRCAHYLPAIKPSRNCLPAS